MEKYYLNLNENNYLLCIYSANNVAESMPFITSLDEYNFDGCRLEAYYWDGEKLNFDENKYLELQAIEVENEQKIAQPSPQADTDAMLIDLEYRLTLLEMGG